MAYATQDDLVPQRITLADLIELTTEDDDATEPDATVVTGALNTASAQVDSYCGQRYKTPLQASELVTNLTADLALYTIASRRRNTKPSETWTQNRDYAMSFLKDVAAGRASLDQPVNAQPQASSADVTVTREPQVFDDCNTRGYW